jgi:membrane protease YdiL (CAAX protease family)
MLSAKPWRMDALVRLFASVLICVVFLSASATSALHLLSRPHDHSTAFLLSTIGSLVLLLAGLTMLWRAWKLENFMRNLAILLVSIYAGFFLLWLSAGFHDGTEKAMISTTARVTVAVVCFQGASLLLVHGFVREHGLTWREAFGLTTRFKYAAAMGVVTGMVAIPVTGGLLLLSSFALETIGIEAPEQEAVQVLRASGAWLNRLVLGITAIVLAPVAEELLFRGVLYPAIKQLGFPRLALWVSAALFGMIHGNLAALIPLTVFAVALAWLYERTDNLVAPVAAHMMFNTVNFVMLFTLDTERLPIPK